MNREPLLQVTMRSRFASRCIMPGTIIVPEFDAQGVSTGNGILVTPDKLAELDPPVWLVAGIDGFLVKRKQDEHDTSRHEPSRNLDDEPQNLPQADEPVETVEADREAEKAGEAEASREEGSKA